SETAEPRARSFHLQIKLPDQVAPLLSPHGRRGLGLYQPWRAASSAIRNHSLAISSNCRLRSGSSTSRARVSASCALARYSSDLDAITPGRVRFKTKQSQRAECQPVPRLLHGFGLTPYYT